jgi:hypothetical protein
VAEQDAESIQQEIAAKRRDLVEDVDRLRVALRRQLDPKEQLRAHPRVVLGLALVVGAWFAVSLVRRFRH